MNKLLPGILALLVSTHAMAQSGPSGGGHQGGGRQGMGRGEGREGRGDQRPREVKPVKREKLDKVVTEMFRAADTNHDGIIPIEELHAIVEARREKLIAARFDRIDGNHDGTVGREEFFAWQRSTGSLALSECHQQLSESLVPEAIEPDFGNDADARVLRRFVEPLTSVLIANANVNYDAGLSLDELLAYERKRFDEADRDRNGELSMDEMRETGDPQGLSGRTRGRPASDR